MATAETTVDDAAVVTVIRERISRGTEPDDVVFHLTGDPFDPDALWQSILCGTATGDGIALPSRSTQPMSEVCPACRDARSSTPPQSPSTHPETTVTENEPTAPAVRLKRTVDPDATVDSAYIVLVDGAEIGRVFSRTESANRGLRQRGDVRTWLIEFDPKFGAWERRGDAVQALVERAGRGESFTDPAAAPSADRAERA